MLLFVEILLHGAVDMFATFESFKLCSHLLKSDSRPFKSTRNAVINAFRRGLVGFVIWQASRDFSAEYQSDFIAHLYCLCDWAPVDYM